jgi:hypothetical protein
LVLMSASTVTVVGAAEATPDRISAAAGVGVARTVPEA